MKETHSLDSMAVPLTTRHLPYLALPVRPRRSTSRVTVAATPSASSLTFHGRPIHLAFDSSIRSVDVLATAIANVVRRLDEYGGTEDALVAAIHGLAAEQGHSAQAVSRTPKSIDFAVI
jgi:hypothetical protein